MNKRRTKLAVMAIVVALIASGALYLGITSYQPIQHVDWKQKINGFIGEVILDNSSIYVANYSSHPANNNPFVGNYSYSVYKINSSSGRIEWISSPLAFQGFQSQFFNEGGHLGPKIWIQNGSLFAMDGNTANFQFTQYTLYSINVTSGDVSGFQKISFPYMDQQNNTTFYPVVLTQGSEMYLSQVHSVYHPATLLSYSTTDFLSYRYQLHNRTYTLVENDSISIPNLDSYNWGSEHSMLADNIEITYIDGMGKIIINNLKDYHAHLLNMTPEAMSGTQNSVFVATISNSTLGIHAFNSANLNGSLVFNYSSPIFDVDLSYSPISMSVLPDGLFLIDYNHQAGNYINGTYVQSDCQLIALDKSGDIVWSYNYSSFPYFMQYGIAGSNNILVSIHTTNSGAYIYPQAKFILINYTDGRVLWSHTYLSSTTGNGNSAFLEPANFNGMLLVANNKILFKLGNSIELANVPR